MNRDFSGMGVDLYYGSPDDPQPDWRDGDPDDKIDDNDDPAPIAPRLLIEMLGFDPDQEEWPSRAQRFNENHDEKVPPASPPGAD